MSPPLPAWPSCTLRTRRAGKPGPGPRRCCSTPQAPVAARTPALPRRGRVILLSRGEPQAGEWEAAIAVGAQHVMTLPADEAELVAALSEAAESRRDDGRRGAVVAVMAGRGGAGASLVRDCSRTDRAQSALLVDADPWSGGIDLVVGSEDEPGLRWPDLALEHGRLDYRRVAPGVAAAGRAQRAVVRPRRQRRRTRPVGCGDRGGPTWRRDRGLRSAAPSDACGRIRRGRGRLGRA